MMTTDDSVERFTHLIKGLQAEQAIENSNAYEQCVTAPAAYHAVLDAAGLLLWRNSGGSVWAPLWAIIVCRTLHQPLGALHADRLIEVLIRTKQDATRRNAFLTLFCLLGRTNEARRQAAVEILLDGEEI